MVVFLTFLLRKKNPALFNNYNAVGTHTPDILYIKAYFRRASRLGN